jgi:uridine kinase
MAINPFTIGIAGASGSGKSYFTKKIKESLNNRVLCLSQDDYYEDRSQIPLEQREVINYDHPNAIDFDLLRRHLIRLKNGDSIEMPLYDFTVHTRRLQHKTCRPADIILLEGILIFSNKRLHSLIDFKIFVDTPLDICLARRLKRDITERGRSIDSVIDQYLTTVRPMYLKYVLPGKKIADFVVVGEGTMEKSLSSVLRVISNDRL